MIITEPIGSIPRHDSILDGIQKGLNGDQMDYLYKEAIKGVVEKFKRCGSPIVTDGEQSKPSFATYCIAGSTQFKTNGGPVVNFEDGHKRELPLFVGPGPFKYTHYSGEYVRALLILSDLPIKQSVISPSMISLFYPQEEIKGYSKNQFIEDVILECERDIRSAFDSGASVVQLDATELRLSLKLDPSGSLLESLIDIIQKVLEKFTPEELKRIGIHTCPGGDQDSTHSLDVEYDMLIPKLFSLKCGRFYLEFAGEKDQDRVLNLVSNHFNSDSIIFFGVTNPINPQIETPEEVCNLVLKIAERIPIGNFGTCDDCGFSPFADDTSTSQDAAFAKISARIEGTKQASAQLGEV